MDHFSFDVNQRKSIFSRLRVSFCKYENVLKTSLRLYFEFLFLLLSCASITLFDSLIQVIRPAIEPGFQMASRWSLPFGVAEGAAGTNVRRGKGMCSYLKHFVASYMQHRRQATRLKSEE
mmetsp:Transcript_38728/g.57601  ORF Transcript_38728/g.57601 Transcript_38728/m.57601 type:complete len:120 (-) Transcript_38728:494-853(-)